MTVIDLPRPPGPWRRRVLVGTGGLVALVASFLAGRYSLPARIEERVKVETKTVTVTEWRDRVVEKVVQGPVRTRTITIERLGEKTTDTVEERGPVTSDRSLASGGSTIAKADQRAELVKVTENPRPGWRGSLSAGWAPRDLRLGPSVYEIRLERRISGTLWLGAWGRTDKTAGLSLGLEW